MPPHGLAVGVATLGFAHEAKACILYHGGIGRQTLFDRMQMQV